MSAQVILSSWHMGVVYEIVLPVLPGTAITACVKPADDAPVTSCVDYLDGRQYAGVIGTPAEVWRAFDAAEGES